MRVTKGQLCGATAVVLIITSLYLYRFSLHHLRPLHNVEKEKCSVVVELTGDTNRSGIYFMPPKPTVSDLFRMAKIRGIKRFNGKDLSVVLRTGEKIIIDSNQVKRGRIDAAKRIALDMPIDINNTTAYNLTLIPGIGKKTAQAIVEFREKAGGITSIDDLLKVHGIGEKRLVKIKKYFYIGDETRRMRPEPYKKRKD